MSHDDKEVLPARLDPQVMADQNRELTGFVPSEGMLRLKNSVVSMEPMVAVCLQFSRGLYGLPRVTGWIKHTLGLRCERCLDEVAISLDQPIEVFIRLESEELPEITDNLEFYEYAGKSLELADLIEDELLLALPLFPKHEDISLCNQDMIAWLATNEVSAENVDSPFAILKR